jgi:hypothetical protein
MTVAKSGGCWRLEDIVKKRLDRSIIFAPVLADTLRNNYADFLESIVAGTRRLDCGVEREEIGLRRDFRDYARHRSDLADDLCQ